MGQCHLPEAKHRRGRDPKVVSSNNSNSNHLNTCLNQDLVVSHLVAIPDTILLQAVVRLLAR